MKTILMRELQSALTDRKFALITLLAVMLLWTGAYIMTRDFQSRMENYEVLKPQDGEAASLVPPTALSFLARGIDENLCRRYDIRFGGQIEVGSKQQSVNGLFRLFETPDWLFVVRVVLALAAMLMAFNSVSGEKEAGTLKLTLSNTISRPQWMLGKWLGGFIVFITPVLTAMLLALAVIQFNPSFQLGSEAWTATGLWITVSILYIATFYSLAFLISALCHRSATSLIWSLFAWAMLVFVWPNLGNLMAKAWRPLPAAATMEQHRQQIWIKAVFQRISGAQPGTDMEAVINHENQQMMDDFRTHFNAQTELSKTLTRFSPAAAYAFFSTDLAGTGIREESRLKQAVIAYKDQIVGRSTDSDGNVTGAVPVFSYSRSTLGDRMAGDAWVNIALIVLYGALFFAASLVAIQKYDVR